MTYGTREYKNGVITGELIFNTGKKVFLNKEEQVEFVIKLRYAEWTGREKEKRDIERKKTI